jgi:Tfp pilus assembly protein PilF
MSLISDALKAAQRERLQRSAGQPSAPLTETIMPYSREASRLPSWFLPVGFGLAVVASVGTALLMHPRASSRPRQAAVAPQPTTSNTPSTPPPVAEARTPHRRTPPSLAVSTRPTATVIQPRPAPRNRAKLSAPARNSVVDSREAATQETSPPESAAQPNLRSIGTGLVRLVIEPGGTPPGDSLARLAYAEHVMNNLERARDLYEKAIATKQAPAETFNNYGALLLQQGNAAMATEMFRRATAGDDTNVDAWVNLGDAFIAAGNHGSALPAFERARQLDPSRASIKIRLASEYLGTGDTTGARRMYEEVVRTHPDDARAHHAYGTLLQAVKDYRGAIREFDLFVETAEKSSGEFTPEKIDEMRRHIASLRRVVP